MGLTASDIAPGLLLGEGAEIGKGVVFGANVVVHGDSLIGDGCTIGDGAVIGKRPMLAPTSSAIGELSGPARLGKGVRVGAQAIVFASAAVGDGSIVGDQAYIRERATIGGHTVVGRATTVDNDVTVGSRVSIQTGCYICARSLVEDDVFIGPGVVTTNSNTMMRSRPGEEIEGVVLKRASRIGGAAVIAPGVTVGEEVYVGAGAVVIEDVKERSCVVGVPARVIREVDDRELLEKWR